MRRPAAYRPDPELDLVLERVVDVPKELAWSAWTTPEHVNKWFTPAPWTTVDCEIDLRPGGIVRTVMRSPEGKEYSHVGCYLQATQPDRLVWTVALEPGYRPANRTSDVPTFTAVITLEPAADGKSTKYTALAMHQDENGCRKHDAIGFHEGWGKTLDQPVEMGSTLR